MLGDTRPRRRENPISFEAGSLGFQVETELNEKLAQYLIRLAGLEYLYRGAETV